MSDHFRGKGKTLKNPIEFTVESGFYFGGKHFPVGSRVKQFETSNFGWTLRIDNANKAGFAQRLGKE